jgi:hypothetical protein
MKKLFKLLLIALFAIPLVSSCVSVTPATKSFSVTSDILEVWIDGVPYLVEDPHQHYRNLLLKDSDSDSYFFIKKKVKGELYEVVANQSTSTGNEAIEEGQLATKFIKVFTSQADYFVRPWRN